MHESLTNPRRTFGESKLEELAESSRQHGLIQPIAVGPPAAPQRPSSPSTPPLTPCYPPAPRTPPAGLVRLECGSRHPLPLFFGFLRSRPTAPLCLSPHVSAHRRAARRIRLRRLPWLRHERYRQRQNHRRHPNRRHHGYLSDMLSKHRQSGAGHAGLGGAPWRSRACALLKPGKRPGMLRELQAARATGWTSLVSKLETRYKLTGKRKTVWRAP